jgi:hypothetical protein
MIDGFAFASVIMHSMVIRNIKIDINLLIEVFE